MSTVDVEAGVIQFTGEDNQLVVYDNLRRAMQTAVVQRINVLHRKSLATMVAVRDMRDKKADKDIDECDYDEVMTDARRALRAFGKDGCDKKMYPAPIRAYYTSLMVNMCAELVQLDESMYSYDGRVGGVTTYEEDLLDDALTYAHLLLCDAGKGSSSETPE